MLVIYNAVLKTHSCVKKLKSKPKLKPYTFENSSLSEYNWVKVVLFFKQIEFN